jgi:AcrR family transcriptional regulator
LPHRIKSRAKAKTPRKKAKRSYHHGDLRDALLKAAEKILRSRGLAGLTLRAIAREAGVSHGAPAHHFPDLSTLLSELVAVGFGRLADYLEKGLTAPGVTRRNTDHAYLEFALANRAMFLLMFRDDQFDPRNPTLRAARARTFGVLAKIAPDGRMTPRQRIGAMTSAWSMVHGFSILAVENRLVRLLDDAPDLDVGGLLDLALDDVEKTRLVIAS